MLIVVEQQNKKQNKAKKENIHILSEHSAQDFFLVCIAALPLPVFFRQDFLAWSLLPRTFACFLDISVTGLKLLSGLLWLQQDKKNGDSVPTISIYIMRTPTLRVFV